MIVYPASAEKATCPVAGCGCAQRAPRYPSDMTDAEWEVLGPQARAVMAELRHGPGGRPMAHRLRVVVDAIRYLVRYGVEWRALPADFPPWQAVYAFFERWAARGLPQRVVDRLRGQLRVGAGRAETADRRGDRLPVGQGRGHGRGRYQRIRWRESCRAGGYAGFAASGGCRGSSAGVRPVRGPA